MKSWEHSVGRWIVVLLAALVMAPLAQAVAVRGLYRQEVTVASQSRADRSAGTREAMQTVLIRVSGDPGIAANDVIGNALDHATAYLNRYGYRRQTMEEAEQAANAAASAAIAASEAEAGPTGQGGTAQPAASTPSTSATAAVTPGYVLTLEFRKEAIDDLLRQAGEPLWPADRPGVLAWVEVDGSGGSYVITADSPQASRQLLDDPMQRRGVALILPKSAPTVDLFDAVGEGRFDVVDTASAAYDADVVLVGTVTEQWQGRWQSVWTVREGDAVQRWQFERDTAGDAMAAAADALANRMARRYAVVAGNGNVALLLRVDDLKSFDAYSDLLRYLNGLAMISKVEVASVDGSTISFRLVSSTDAGRLTDTLALQKHLEPVATPVATTEQALTDLHYRWVP